MFRHGELPARKVNLFFVLQLPSRARHGFRSVPGGLLGARHKKQVRLAVLTDSSPSLDDTLISAFEAGIEFLNENKTSTTNGPFWTTLESEASAGNGRVLYSKFRIDSLPPTQGRYVGNVLRRTLLRQDIFRSYAAVAMRARHRLLDEKGVPCLNSTEDAVHEFSSVVGVQECMMDIMHNVQQLAIRGPDEIQSDAIKTWQWTARRCGPCIVNAGDLQIVDSAAHHETPLMLLEPAHYICRINSPVMVEIEVDVACCSHTEYQDRPDYQRYVKTRRNDGWLSVLPDFSLVQKVNYVVQPYRDTRESVILEVWTRASRSPQKVLQKAMERVVQVWKTRNIDSAT